MTATSNATSAPATNAAPEQRPVAQPQARTNATLPREGLSKPAASGESTARAFRALLGSKDAPPAELDLAEDRPQLGLHVPIERPALTIAAVAPASESGALSLDPAAAEAIGKLANAVAEALARGRDPVITVQFNDPAALSQGALLVREASGALTVRLEGVAAAALALPPRALEDQLRVALDRRRVRLGRLEWGAIAGAQSRVGRSESR
jgi:hypothetical protein